MSNNMNMLTDKVGEVARSVNALTSEGINSIDSTEQTRMRQEHLGHLSQSLRNGEFTAQDGTVNVGAIIGELDTIASRCPSVDAMKTYASEFRRKQGIVQAEMGELYEVVEKMRDLDAASTGQGEPTRL
ncbi:MAG: hypothetical protein WBG86_16010 [Polyangiales bacterium]